MPTDARDDEPRHHKNDKLRFSPVPFGAAFGRTGSNNVDDGGRGQFLSRNARSALVI